MASMQNSKKTTTKIQPSVEERIVEMSLQHPDRSARRLIPVLEQEGIQVSTTAVYAILKRNEVQTKSNRLSKLETQRNVETPPGFANTTPSEAEQEDYAPAHSAKKKPQRRISPAVKAIKKTNPRRPWALSVPNLILLGIIGYFWFSAIGNFLNARHDQPTLSTKPEPTQAASKSQIPVRPLSDYDLIAERNLFGASSEGVPDQEEQGEEVLLEELPQAGKNLGLRLVGTIAAREPQLRSAIIENSKTRKQEIYQEGDQIGDILVKRILRHNVILGTGKGEEVLTMAFEQTPGGSRSPNQPVSKYDQTSGESPKPRNDAKGQVTRSPGKSVSKDGQTDGDPPKRHKRVRGIIPRSSGKSVSKNKETGGDTSKRQRRVRGMMRRE